MPFFTLEHALTEHALSENTDAENAVKYKTEIALAKSHLQSGRFDDAISVAKTILKDVPHYSEALYIRAVSERYAQRYQAAQRTLHQLKSLNPEYGRAMQEEGHIYTALGQTDEALRAYQHATQLNPGLEASWKAQAEILRVKGHAIEAANAQGHYERMVSLPKELHAVTNLMHEGKLVKAERLCKHYMQGDKTNVEGMRLLADIASRFGANDEADFLYETALELEPGNVAVRLDYIAFLRKVQKFEQSVEHARHLNKKHPNNAVLESALAVQSQQVGDYDTAFEMFERVLQKIPNDPITLTSRGHTLKTYGRQEEAITSYRRAFEAKPDHGDAYFSLANLKTYRFTETEITAMEAALKAPNLSLQNRAYFSFALGKAYEDAKDFAKAFAHYDEGNRCKRVQSRYDADKMTDEMQRQMDVCTPELFERLSESGHTASDPIFILGLPRAGSTLLEQILASHSQVDGTLELPNILALANRLKRMARGRDTKDYPTILRDLPQEKYEEFGKAFIDDTQIHRQGAPFFIDKMPNNFRHIGLIHLILPNAKIIDARRHPMACCFSGFKQLFAEGQEFTYGLTQVGQYYRDYVNLMDHWDAVLPGKVLRVQYEEVVADTEGQVRRMLDYLGLSFEEACVEFHKTERSVRTASSEQVRQPIYQSGLEQWRHFEDHLDPLKEALGSVLERYPV